MTITEALEFHGMKNIHRVYASYCFEYNNHKFEMWQTEGGYDFQTFVLKMDEKNNFNKVQFQNSTKKNKRCEIMMMLYQILIKGAYQNEI